MQSYDLGVLVDGVPIERFTHKRIYITPRITQTILSFSNPHKSGLIAYIIVRDPGNIVEEVVVRGSEKVLKFCPSLDKFGTYTISFYQQDEILEGVTLDDVPQLISSGSLKLLSSHLLFITVTEDEFDEWRRTEYN